MNDAVLRIWRTSIDPARAEEYARFEQEQSAPMFAAQRGCLGVFFVRTGPDTAAAVSWWEDEAAVHALADSPSYRETAARLAASGMLRGQPALEVMTVAASWMRER